MRSVRSDGDGDGGGDDLDEPESSPNRPRVLCVSSDRSTRAAVTLSLTDDPVDVVVAKTPAEATAQLENGAAIHAVVLDARTLSKRDERSAGNGVTTEAPLLDVLDSEAHELPTFVHWGLEGESEREPPADADPRRLEGRVTVLSEGGSGPTDDADAATTAERLARAVVDRVCRPDDAAVSSDRTADEEVGEKAKASTGDGTPPHSRVGPDSGPTLAEIVDAVRRRLVDVTSPLAVEEILREEFTRSDRFAFAWVGEYDRGEGEIVPWITDSTQLDWPLQRTFGVGTEETLLRRAVRDRDLRVAANLESEPDAVPFGEEAASRGVETVAAAPLGPTERGTGIDNDDELYGLFVVYARDSLADADRDAIQDVAAVASHVLETIAVRGQLEQQERVLQRYERLVETAGDGMCVLDEQGHFMTVNEALTEMTGYSREGLLGEHVSLLFADDDVAAGEEVVRSLLGADASTDTLEITLEQKDGRTTPCEGQIAVLEAESGLEGVVCVVRDITERKRSERKLREQNERLDAFARVVSHDLRNPLSVAQGYLDLIQETGSTEHVEQIQDGLDRMEGIIDDVLSIARGGDWAAEPEPVTLEGVASEAWDHVSTPSASFAVHESTARPDGQTPFEADRERLLRLFENLFRNSVEHGGSDVTVRTGPLEDGGTVTGFFVADDGSGLPEELREREDVFDPSVSSSSEGLGIGLWVVREVATGHGWSVTATESRSEGARFEFRFEFAADDETEQH
ncbi:two-component system sensor histidine kinase NtrB [Halobiforma nitratireducens]|uniref:histidine kinase n=1 Tax=Halobiforma nitratireducens JCM 10879 TaxID=1227454 RepID=M0M6J6_9EURY|nr:PAS domain-containing sensor histidine kinase [Halobiforma nitratireducens]EMA40244.1 putative signal-transducing histidine kinase / response regulator [Halobiforma nitratireducens JCM 10879]